MNKQLGFVIGLLFFVFLASFLAIKLSFENLQAERAKKEELIAVLQNQRLGLIAQEQSFENEARVVPIAEMELGLVKETISTYHLDVLKDDINTIQLLVNKKNESK
ncbi:MAG: hypothetical protein HYV28_09200 [Ignavibacteriales bacterium]|nr:hypothetical protein [Ignavibacteriales bacterium]